MRTAPGDPPADTDEDLRRDGAAASALALPTNLAWSAFKNTAAQVVGRILIALSRLVVAGLIVRSFGRDRFGEYSLVFAILMVAEWMVDFGVTELFVREICREPRRGQRLLRIATAAKSVQVPAAAIVLVTILLALRYPGEIVKAALVGGAGMIFYGGVLIYRIVFKASLTMERDAASELVSVLVMVPLLWLACSYGASLSVLIGCHFISRAVFFVMSYLLGRKRYRPSVEGVTWQDVRWGLRASAAIGAVGLLSGAYETLDILLLSKLGTLSDLGYYAGAQRLVWPARVALASIGATLYPIVSSYWPHAQLDFERTLQKGLNTVVVLGGLVVCTLVAGAEFFLGLIGPQLVGGAAALRILAVLCFVQAITSTVGPVLFVVHAQKYALWLITVAVVVKAAVIAPLVPRFGYVGVAIGTLAVDAGFVMVLAVYLVRRHTGYRLRWLVPIKAAAGAAAAAFVARLLVPGNGLLAVLVAAATYAPLAFLSGAAQLSDIRALLRWRTG